MKSAIRRKHHYTLVEIMTVIVIATILFAIGIPAFSTMIRGSNMTMAIRQLSAKIQAARAYAVTNRCKTAVLLVENLTDLRDENRDSAYRACVINDDKSWQGWIEDENWAFLPKTVVRHTLPATMTEVTSVPVTDISSADKPAVKALIFDKKGQLDGDNSLTIKLRQGRYVSGSVVYTERDGDGKIISHPIEVTKYTGKVKVKDVEHDSE